MDCRKMNAQLTDLLLDAAAVPAEVRRHVEDCALCRTQLAELNATMALLDQWQAPEPTPYFDGKLHARLRSEQSAPPAGFLERLRARLLFGSNLHMQPLVAGALALVILIGGGTYADLRLHSAPRESATVRDLQSLDGNAQVFQQLDSVDQQDDTSGASSSRAND